jgi:hypothetical protein
MSSGLLIDFIFELFRQPTDDVGRTSGNPLWFRRYFRRSLLLGG